MTAAGPLPGATRSSFIIACQAGLCKWHILPINRTPRARQLREQPLVPIGVGRRNAAMTPVVIIKCQSMEYRVSETGVAGRVHPDWVGGARERLQEIALDTDRYAGSAAPAGVL
jgi:hypothetical protein